MAERLFTSVPEIGPKLAKRLHEELGIETLNELEAAAKDGRLGQVHGMGKKRVQAVGESLAGRRFLEKRQLQESRSQIPVAELLDVDHQYRKLANLDELPRIAPRSFNPTGEAWLPILHCERGNRHYTALFSNTSRAHELGTVRDWVVIYRDDPSGHGRWTVITANFGPLQGRRIVVGREPECVLFYAKQTS